MTTALQNLVFPDPAFCDDAQLYMRLDAAAHTGDGIALEPGGAVSFDTWVNMFHLAKWRRHCRLTDLSLRLMGQGPVEIELLHGGPDHPPQPLLRQRADLVAGTPLVVPLTRRAGVGALPLLGFRLRALDHAQLHQASWITANPPRREPSLLVAVTTYRREDTLRRSAERFSRYVAQGPLRGRAQMAVIDNGGTLGRLGLPFVSVIASPNLGGAGGFARGLIAAQAQGASHCVFMDDDAAIHMESLARTWAMLAYAHDTSLTIAGSLMTAATPWVLWEAGACFDTTIKGCHRGADMRAFDEFAAVEATQWPEPGARFGGWWYFAFPVEKASQMPFPFFVRGDDVGFSLSHEFKITTLNGVTAFQHQDFAAKESPLTAYLDLRSHLANHLAHPQINSSWHSTLRLAGFFFLRHMAMMHYETMAAMVMALEDVLAGPAHFAAHPDAGARRTQIAALCQTEVWRPLAPAAAPRRAALAPWQRALYLATLNGHLLPGFGALGQHITLPITQRGITDHALGAAQITYVDHSGARGYTVAHSKKRGFAQLGRALAGMLRLAVGFGALRRKWRSGYRLYASQDYWRSQLSTTEAPQRKTGT